MIRLTSLDAAATGLTGGEVAALGAKDCLPMSGSARRAKRPGSAAHGVPPQQHRPGSADILSAGARSAHANPLAPIAFAASA